MKPHVLIILTLLLLSLIGVSAAAEPLTFDENGEFTILIVADTQDNDHPQQAMLNLLNASLDTAKPDLVVFLGDQFNGYAKLSEIEGPALSAILDTAGAVLENPFSTDTIGSLYDFLFPTLVGDDPDKVRAGVDAIISPLQERGIPFAFVFGNHDDQGSLTKEEQYAIYTSYDNCLAWDAPNLTGKSNYYLLLNNTAGTPVFAFWFIDSGSYAPDGIGKYAWVAEDQIRWYQQTADILAEQNGGQPLPAFSFQHIIVPEIYNTLTEVPFGTPGALAGKFSHAGKFYLPNPEYITSGSLNEAPAPPDYNSGEFAAWKNQGDVIAAFFGHDHDNDFSATWQGIDLVATPGIGFFIYGNGEYHGTRMVTLHENDLQNYSTKLLYYKDIVSEPLPGGIVSTYGAFVQQIVLTVLVTVAALVICIGLLIWVVHREKQKRKR